jgi:hypothetical protein
MLIFITYNNLGKIVNLFTQDEYVILHKYAFNIFVLKLYKIVIDEIFWRK